MPEPSYSVREIKELAHILGFAAARESEHGVAFTRLNRQGVLPDVVSIVATDNEARVPESVVVDLFEDAGNSRDFIYEGLNQIRP